MDIIVFDNGYLSGLIDGENVEFGISMNNNLIALVDDAQGVFVTRQAIWQDTHL